MEAFHVALDLWVSGPAVLVDEAVRGEEFLEPAAVLVEAGQAGGEHASPVPPRA